MDVRNSMLILIGNNKFYKFFIIIMEPVALRPHEALALNLSIYRLIACRNNKFSLAAIDLSAVLIFRTADATQSRFFQMDLQRG